MSRILKRNIIALIIIISCIAYFSCKNQKQEDFTNNVNKPLDTTNYMKWVTQQKSVNTDRTDNNGWFFVKPSVETMAVVSNKDSIFSAEFRSITEQLNKLFNKGHQYASKEPDYVYSGLLVHILDSYNITNTKVQDYDIFSLIQDYIATSYIRKDVTKGIKKPLWNGTFHIYAKGTPAVGLIYFHIIDNGKDNQPYVLCEYPADASSDRRFLGCSNVRAEVLTEFNREKVLPENEESFVKEMYDKKESINTCNIQGLGSEDKYLTQKIIYEEANHQHLCALSGNTKDFNSMLGMYNLLKKNPNHFQEDLKEITWNEVIVRFFNVQKYKKSVMALFYMDGSSNYYRVPQGDLTPYNIHLAAAQKFQKNIMQKDGQAIPILKLDMDKVTKGKDNPLSYDFRDQNI